MIREMRRVELFGENVIVLDKYYAYRWNIV